MNHLTNLCEDIYRAEPDCAIDNISHLLGAIAEFVSANGYEVYWQCKLEEIGLTFDPDGEIVQVAEQ